jgi:adenylate cyclase
MRTKSAGGGQRPKEPAGAAPAPTAGPEVVVPTSTPPLGHRHAHQPHIEFRFFEQLKHRNVVRVAVLYLVVCWLILDPVHVVFHMLEVPAWANRLVVLLMAIGFPAVLLFSWVYEVTPEGLKPTVEVDPAKSITHKTGQRLNQAIIVVLSVALVYFVADKFWLAKRLGGAQPAEASTKGTAASIAASSVGASTTTASDKSIAVLPFLDMSERHDQEYFSDGLSEELIELLSKLPQLQVIARTSSFSFKGKSDDIPTIGRKLNVANVLEGSVRKSGNRLRVTTQLIRADSGVHIWSDTYDRDLKDVFKVQDEIAGAVVAALKVHLVPSQQLHESYRTGNTEAYNQYLLGRQFHKLGTLDNVGRAIKAYRNAIELDPKFAAAYAGLSISQFMEADQIADNAGYDRAMASAEKAVALAPEEADGYESRGVLRESVYWDWPGARADLEKALQLAPGESRSHLYYGMLLSDLGRMSEAKAEMKKAVELDPLSRPAWVDLGYLLAELHEFSAAHEAARHALEISPEDPYSLYLLGNVFLIEGRYPEAIAAYRKVNLDLFRLCGLAEAEHFLGQPRESQQALEELIAKYAANGAMEVAYVYAWRGEKDKAFEWLERAYRQRDGDLSPIKHVEALRSLHDDPRFVAMLRKLKLPE